MNEQLFGRLIHDPKALEHYNKGVVRQRENNHAKAAECFQEAICLEPAFEEAYFNLGVAYDNMGKHKQAVECFQKVLQLNPLTIKAHYQMGVAFGKQGQYDDAIRCFQETLRMNPHYAEAYYSMAYAYSWKDQWNDALRYAAEALRLKPDHLQAHILLCTSHAQLGQYNDLIRVCQETLSQLPKDNLSPKELNRKMHAHNGMGDGYMALNRPADAADHYRATLRCYEEAQRMLPFDDAPPELRAAIKEGIALMEQKLASAQKAVQASATANPKPDDKAGGSA